MKDTIAEALGMNELEIVDQSVTGEVVTVNPDADVKDFTEVKENLRQLINKTTPAFNSLIALALASESPKVYEQLTGMMRVMVEANREIADTRTKEVSVTGERAPTTINNNLNISTTDLLKMIKDNS